MPDRKIDVEIAALQRQLQQLEARFAQEAERGEKLRQLDHAVIDFQRRQNVANDEIFEARGDQLLAWLRAEARKPERHPIYEQLREHFASLRAD